MVFETLALAGLPDNGIRIKISYYTESWGLVGAPVVRLSDCLIYAQTNCTLDSKVLLNRSYVRSLDQLVPIFYTKLPCWMDQASSVNVYYLHARDTIDDIIWYTFSTSMAFSCTSWSLLYPYAPNKTKHVLPDVISSSHYLIASFCVWYPQGHCPEQIGESWPGLNYLLLFIFVLRTSDLSSWHDDFNECSFFCIC